MSTTPYIYADNAATTPLSPRAREAMMPYLSGCYGNPSGIHRVARDAALALKQLRGNLAELLGARAPEEIYLTSGGSESDTWVLRGAVRRYQDQAGSGARLCLITSAIEHHAILHNAQALEREGVEVVYLTCDALGRVSPADLEEALAAREGRVALVSIMLANNEVGTVQDIAALARIAHAHQVPFHTDAVQAVGHLPLNIQELGIDALSLSAHKFHGPHGIGALYLREGFSIPALIEGGGQERHLRAGTENLAGLAGMAAALEESLTGLDERIEKLTSLRDELLYALAQTPGVLLTGDTPGLDGATSAATVSTQSARAFAPTTGLPWRRLPSIASCVCHNVDAELLCVLLDRAGVAAATGSACSTGSPEPSHVIEALGITDPRWSHGSLRLSLADDIDKNTLTELCERVPACIERCRRLSGTIDINA